MKEGRQPKDLVFTEGFNREKIGMTKLDLALAKKAAAVEEKKKRLAREMLRKAEVESKRLEKEAIKIGLEKLAKDAVEAMEGTGSVPGDEVDTDDDKSANQMLADMRWVYRKVKGRKRLKELIEGDDKQFVFMIKELMKIEAAKIMKNKDDGSPNQTVFVVLKGLDEEKKYLVDDAVNLKQVQHVIQPESGEFEPEPEVEKMEVTL